MVPVSTSDRPGAALATLLLALVWAIPSMLKLASCAFCARRLLAPVAGSHARVDRPGSAGFSVAERVKALLAPVGPFITSCAPVAVVAT